VRERYQQAARKEQVPATVVAFRVQTSSE
jgi:hypothetical protein